MVTVDNDSAFKCFKFDSFTMLPHCLRDSGRPAKFLIFWRNVLYTTPPLIADCRRSKVHGADNILLFQTVVPCVTITGTPVNVARGKFAKLLTAHGKYPASNAVDGGLTDTYMAHSGFGMPTWFYVDLDKIMCVDRIRILNRKACCGEFPLYSKPLITKTKYFITPFPDFVRHI